VDGRVVETPGINDSPSERDGPRGGAREHRRKIAVLLLAGGVGCGGLQGADIPIPNGSFESPATEFADPRIDAWQETPKPDWYDETESPWDFLTGVFMNPAPGSADHIDNCDGRQALFLFAVPTAGLFQDYASTDWSSTTPTHAFDAKFEVGRAYQLTVGVAGGGGGMKAGCSLLVELYYRDAAAEPVRVAATSLVHTPDLFPNLTHLVDFTVEVPTVRAHDAWADQHLGIQIISTVDPALAGGYWDLDHVRLKSIRSPVLVAPGFAAGQFGFTIESEPGLTVEILSAADPGLPLPGWTSVATLTNTTGTLVFRDERAATERRFYQARQVE